MGRGGGAGLVGGRGGVCDPPKPKKFRFSCQGSQVFLFGRLFGRFFFQKKCVQKRDFGGVFMCFFCTGSSSGPPSPSPWPGPYVQLFKRLLKQIFMFFTKNFLSLGGGRGGCAAVYLYKSHGSGKIQPAFDAKAREAARLEHTQRVWRSACPQLPCNYIPPLWLRNLYSFCAFTIIVRCDLVVAAIKRQQICEKCPWGVCEAG